MNAALIHFVPKGTQDACSNLKAFIACAKHKLHIFGKDLEWDSPCWPAAGLTFGNLDQKTRTLDVAKVMRQPFLDFAKAYLRYQQAHRPTVAKIEMRAIRCLERALCDTNMVSRMEHLNSTHFDLAATIARSHYSPGAAYHTGRELERLAQFVSERRLIGGHVTWKNPIRKPTDNQRTGKEAKERRERKLPQDAALDALAGIFAGVPEGCRDVFTSSTSALLLCAPSRISEVLSLPVDCEVSERKRDGTTAYGLRFQPSKGGAPMIKWIPDTMVSLAQEALRRLRELSAEARSIAKWYEKHPTEFYLHEHCPQFGGQTGLTAREAVAALVGLRVTTRDGAQQTLRRYGLPTQDGANTLDSLLTWARERLPLDFPWFDKSRGLRFSDALYAVRERQLRTDMPPSPILLARPTANIINKDLETSRDGPKVNPSIFDRHHYNTDGDNSLKLTTHQFRHLLNTVAQRGGLSQSELARWSGRTDVKQNRAYDHMSEFEMVDLIRKRDPSLQLDVSLQQLAERIAERLPITRSEFNALAMPAAHITEYGFCVHDYVMSPCEKFRDCLNCVEQVCVKGDSRLGRVEARHKQVKLLRAQAEVDASDGDRGADRWLEIHRLTDDRLTELIAILRDEAIPSGAVIKLRNDHAYSPTRLAVEQRHGSGLTSPVSDAVPSTSSNKGH